MCLYTLYEILYMLLTNTRFTLQIFVCRCKKSSTKRKKSARHLSTETSARKLYAVPDEVNMEKEMLETFIYA